MKNHPFKTYADSIFPEYLRTLRDSEMYAFAETFPPNKGVKTFLKKIGKTADFKGTYILYDPEVQDVIYVGISRNVIARLNQHYRGDNHFSGNLAYKFTKNLTDYKGKRADLLDLTPGREIIQRLHFQFVEIEDAIERYLFEVYVHLAFGTEHNSFETH